MKRSKHDGDPSDGRAVVAGAAAGLAGGLIASWLMVTFQQRIWPPPKGDAGSSTARLARAITLIGDQAPLGEEEAKSAGRLIHYALGAGLGLAYGAAVAVRPGVTAGGGVAFGVATEVVIDQGLVPVLGLANPFWKCPAEWHLRGLAAHVMFGAATETTRRVTLRLIDAAKPASTLRVRGRSAF